MPYTPPSRSRKGTSQNPDNTDSSTLAFRALMSRENTSNHALPTPSPNSNLSSQSPEPKRSGSPLVSTVINNNDSNNSNDTTPNSTTPAPVLKSLAMDNKNNNSSSFYFVDEEDENDDDEDVHNDGDINDDETDDYDDDDDPIISDCNSTIEPFSRFNSASSSTMSKNDPLSHEQTPATSPATVTNSTQQSQKLPKLQAFKLRSTPSSSSNKNSSPITTTAPQRQNRLASLSLSSAALLQDSKPMRKISSNTQNQITNDTIQFATLSPQSYSYATMSPNSLNLRLKVLKRSLEILIERPDLISSMIQQRVLIQ
ncbi:protein serine/threonine kinase activity protein [[Candida] boidinii]|nr:protein serine/threonine kinase activity protein [[Candida] boidinii]